MKKLFLALIICSPVLTLRAQSLDVIKNEFTLQQYNRAKIDVDRAFADGGVITKRAEAHLLKAAIYSSLAMSDANKGNPTGDQLNDEAVVAFNKYREMEPSMGLLNDLVYQSAPSNIYSSFYSSGYNDYSNKKWQQAFEKLKKAVEFSDLLTANGLRTEFDKDVLIIAGITAENSGNRKDAAVFYGRLADNGVSGEGFESLYRFLVNYSFETKNMPSFEKYKAMGSRLYPKSEFFKFDKVDFAVGLAESFTEKIYALEKILVADPDNFKANEILGELLYDTLNPNAENTSLPENADEWESKMVRAFSKAAAAKPGTEIPFLYLGDHFINKAAKIGELRDAFANEMKAMAQAGVTPSAENISKLEQEYAAAMEAALIPYENAAARLANKPNNGNQDQQLRDKQQYKKAVSYLIEIFSYKQSRANKNSPDFGIWTEKVKKWNDVYTGIK